MDIKVKEWTVHLCSDDDGHLTIYVAHTDGSRLYDVDCGEIGGENEIGYRVTTDNIEKFYCHIPIKEVDV